MPLAAVLTIGWPDGVVGSQASARVMHETCQQQADDQIEGYSGQLLLTLSRLRQASYDDQPLAIQGTDQLFRRRSCGFRELQRFIGCLNQIVVSHPEFQNVHCEIDAFAYAFLKGAKNFDFFLPEVSPRQGPFRSVYQRWCQHMEALKVLERDGTWRQTSDVEAYLALRRLIARPSARDERRVLATLLVSGPSTRGEITDDLGLPYALSERILPTFEAIDILERRKDDQYVIKTEALPRVIFCLRQTMGLNLLAVLD